MVAFATSATRVKNQTDQAVQARICGQIQANISYFAAHPQEIDQRLKELDAEWDVERWLEVNSSALSLAGLVLGLLHSRKWLLLPLAVQGFFLEHSLHGYCPPLAALRRAGMRTEDEILAERHALKALRGDFDNITGEEALLAAQL